MDTIARLVKAIGNAPVNIVARAGTPPVAELERIGVARVTIASGATLAVMSLIKKIGEDVARDRHIRRAGAFDEPPRGAEAVRTTRLNTEAAMKARLDFRKASPQGEKAMMGLHMFVRNCGLDHSLLELVKLRASQLNGCAHCIDMHTKELRADGESEQKLYLLNAWRESPFYSDRERAALAWTEAVTLVARQPGA